MTDKDLKYLIKPIREEAEYDAALNRIEQLWNAPQGSPQCDELEILSMLVEKYEEHERILGDKDFVIKETTGECRRYENALKLLSDAGSRKSNIKSLSEVRGFAVRVLNGKKNP